MDGDFSESVSDEYREFRTYKTGMSNGLSDLEGELHPSEFGVDGHTEESWAKLTPEQRNEEMQEALEEWVHSHLDYWVV